MDYQKGQTGQYAGIRFAVQVRTDSKTENPDSTPNNISNHNPKNKYWKKIETIHSKKSGHVSGYVPWERGVTIYPPNKNFVLEISIRREMNI